MVAYWDDIKEAVFGVSEEQKKLNEQVKKNLEAEQSKLDAIGEQDNILKLQGKSEKDILNLKIAQTDQTIQAAEANLESLRQQKKIQVEIAERNKEILKGLLNFLSVPITAILFAVDKTREALGQTSTLLEDYKEGLANLVFDPKKVAEESDATIEEAEKGLTKLKNQRAGFVLSIQQIDKAASDKAKQQREQEIKDALAQQERLRKIAADFNAQEDKINEQRKAAAIEAQKKQDEADAAEMQRIADEEAKKDNEAYEKQNAQKLKQLELQKAVDEAELKSAQELQEAKFQAASSGLQLLAGLIGENEKIANALFVADKALAIGKIIVDTQREIAGIAATNALLGPAGIPITAAQITAAKIRAGVGIATVAAATIAKFKKGSPGSAGGSVPAPSAAPIAPPAPQAALTQLDQTSINRLGSATSRAYVVESDITNSQEKITRINRAARLG